MSAAGIGGMSGLSPMQESPQKLRTHSGMSVAAIGGVFGGLLGFKVYRF